MPHQQNVEFLPPENEHAKVWRYIDFPKLISILHTSTLYFARADKFDDAFEGSYPASNIIDREKFIESQSLTAQKILTNFPAQMSNFVQRCKEFVSINCWHLNDYESVAMWGLYARRNDGIAIQSTYAKLRDCFVKTTEQVHLGKVTYLDYHRDKMTGSSIFSPFLYKRKSFEHEHELRAVLCRLPINADGGLDLLLKPIVCGVNVEVDIAVLVEAIHLAPNTPKWIADNVESVICHYGYKCNVIRSKLDEQPLY